MLGWCQKWKLLLPEQRVHNQSSLALPQLWVQGRGLWCSLSGTRGRTSIPSSRETAIPLTIWVWIWQWKRKRPGYTTWYRTIIHVGPLGPLIREVSLIRGFSSWKNSGCSVLASSELDQLKRPGPTPIMKPLLGCLCMTCRVWMAGLFRISHNWSNRSTQFLFLVRMVTCGSRTWAWYQ